MISRKQPRSIARELALLSLSQIKPQSDKLQQQDLNSLVITAIRSLNLEIADILETASDEVKRSSDRLGSTATRANTVESAKAMVLDAIKMTQTAINRLGTAVELPEFVMLANQNQVRDYGMEIISTVYDKESEIQQLIESVLVAWQYSRLPQIDLHILQIAVAEIVFLDVPKQVAINEAVELAKRYSDDDGYRFINGVLRRVTDRLAELEVAESQPQGLNQADSDTSATEQQLEPSQAPSESFNH